MKNINPLGAQKFGQRSISEHVNKNNIYDIFLTNLSHFENHVKESSDIYAKDLLNN